jgi:hypothetical protein
VVPGRVNPPSEHCPATFPCVLSPPSRSALKAPCA